MADTEKKKYEIWKSRFDERASLYTSFTAESDEEALKVFKKHEDNPHNGMDQLDLYRIGVKMAPVEFREAHLKAVRESSGDDALDLVG